MFASCYLSIITFLFLLLSFFFLKTTGDVQSQSRLIHNLISLFSASNFLLQPYKTIFSFLNLRSFFIILCLSSGFFSYLECPSPTLFIQQTHSHPHGQISNIFFAKFSCLDSPNTTSLVSLILQILLCGTTIIICSSLTWYLPHYIAFIFSLTSQEVPCLYI